jgi:predicted dehydrogenase
MSDTSKPLGIGVIGLGGHAKHHINYWSGHFVTMGYFDPGVEDPSLQRFSTVEDMLASPEVQAVFIASPEEFHIEQSRMALMAGKHVLCEKPMATPEDGADELSDLLHFARENGLAFTSCHPRRFDPPMVWLRNMISPQRHRWGTTTEILGRAVSVEFDFSYHKPNAEWKKGRSLLLDHINHEIDLVNFFFDIQAFEAQKLHDRFDHYEVVGARDDGISVHFKGTRRLDSSRYPEWCRVRFERGLIEVDMMMGVAHVHRHDGSAFDPNRPGVETIAGFQIGYEVRLEGIASAFRQEIDENLPYLRGSEMLMNTQAGVQLSRGGMQRIEVRQIPGYSV